MTENHFLPAWNGKNNVSNVYLIMNHECKWAGKKANKQSGSFFGKY